MANKDLTIEKLYSPLEFYLHNPREEEANGENGEYDLHDERYKISHLEVVDQYADAIELAVRRDRVSLDRVRGMAEYLPEELQGKVHSIFPNVEQRGFDMYCAATIELTAPLTADETTALKDWWRGQLSDGWGEGFEQREIKVGYQGNELYMVTWTSDENVFFLETGAEFAQRMNVSPEYLGVTVPAMLAEQNASVKPAPSVESVGEQGQPELAIAKLYSPIVCDRWETDDDGAYNQHEISSSEAAWHIDEIRAAIQNEGQSEESERGLMAYFHDGGSVDDKVHSLFVDVEVHGNSLWAVSTVELTEPLTTKELDSLRDYITGQFSDGFGEGFEQREIKIEDGELNVHLWNADGEFFIDTQEQFARRIGIELPEDAILQPSPLLSIAQKSLYEPDAFDSQDVATLRKQLLARIDGNLSDYFDTLRSLDGIAIVGRSSEIAMMTEAHFYLSEIYGFHLSDTQYLLQFKNPLEVVANAFEAEGFDNQRSEAMWRIFDKEDALQGDYELVNESADPSANVEVPKGYVIAATEDSDSYISGALHIERDDGLHVYTNDEEAAKAAERDGVKLIYGMPFVPDGVYIDTPENREAIAHSFEQHRLSLPADSDVAAALYECLDQNLADYEVEMLRSDKDTIYDSAEEIYTVKRTYGYFYYDHSFTTGQAEFLLKFQNPLMLLTDILPNNISDIRDATEYVFNVANQERTLNSGSYELASDDPETPPTTISTQEKSRSVAGAGEKPSVIDEIRQSQKDVRENPPATKDKSFDRAVRKNSELDL